ncbi:hypothetical protein TWF696_007057 [Orbilia brochopaga]|uniref:Uncharacterized protein n=1 Tax=Orbilia brochopaga TaxID=3140254 RepID=A0AAV9UQQ5_9PEZI
MSRRLSTRQHQNSQRKVAELEAAAAVPAESSNHSKAEDDVPAASSNSLSKPLSFVGVKSFYTQEQRTKSFVITGARKRQSNAKKGTKSQKWSWPTDHPAPAIMARAGFYFKPGQGDEDNVACFICQKNMSEWDPDDDPAEQHLRHNSSCGWALTMCRDLVIDGKILNDPLGDEMCKARRMTFDSWWPHEGKKAWKPSVQNVVMAGFIFRPQKDGDDTVYCPYCKLSIDAWEQDDDPREAHRNLGSGDCSFMQYIAANSNAHTKPTHKSTVNMGTEDPKEKASLKKKTSRTRKIGTNPQRKRVIPPSQLGPDEYQNQVVHGGDERPDEEESMNPVSEQKVGSLSVESGGKQQFLSDENAARIFQEQVQYIENQQSPKKSQPKRRVTRASMASHQTDLDLVVSVPTHLSHTEDEDGAVGPDSIHNTPLKPKRKEKKNVARSSAASAKSGKKGKSSKAKGPLDIAGMNDDEIDRALERDIMEDGSSVAGADSEAEHRPSGITVELNHTKVPTSSRSPEHKIVKAPMKKGTRRLTRTKPTTRSSPTPESEHIEPQTKSQKPRRKRLTRTKPATRISTESQISLETDTVEAPLYAPSSPKAAAEGMDDPIDPVDDDQPIYNTPPLEPTPLLNQIASDDQVSNANGRDDAVTSPQVAPPPVPDERNQESTDNGDLAASGIANETLHMSPVQSTQLKISPIASFSPSKDRDMKRKSDAVVETHGENVRSGKKRKTISKAVATPKTASPNNSEVVFQKTAPRQVLHALVPGSPKDRVSDESQRYQSTPSRVPSQPVEDAVLCTKPGLENRSPELILRTDPDADTIARVEDTPQEELEEEDTIPDLIFEAPENMTRKSLVMEDKIIDTALSPCEPPCKTGQQQLLRRSSDLQRQISDGPSPPDSPTDTASQDSIPNTQFSAAASQMTFATSFQGSNKGVSFATAEEQLPGEQETSLVVETRARSPSISPKHKVVRTPLSVVPKAHNGGLALMTPRNRTDGVAFAPVRSLKPWRSGDIESYIDGLKENVDLEVEARGLPAAERDMTIGDWITEVARKAEKRLIDKGELLVGFFEAEAEHAVAAIEAIETE